MKTGRLVLSIAIVAGALFLEMFFTPTPAKAWWSCRGGYALQVRSTGSRAVRCFRGAITVNVNPNSCPQTTLPTGQRVGSGFVQDYYRGDGRDACVTQDPTGTAKTAIPHKFCQVGWQYRIRQGARDQCRRPSSEVAPTRNVQ